MTTALWILIGIVLYGYLGYPLTAALAGRLLDRRVRAQPRTPPMSVIIAAFDEEDAIAGRIENVLACDYPADALEVVVASDGSTDATVQIASRFDPGRVRVLDLSRRGKAAALAAAVGAARGEVLLFSDANTVFHGDALRMIARNFADPAVGGVAGNTGYDVGDGADASGRGEDLYWRYDSWIKRLETRTGSVVSAHGGMYAVRRELFRPVEDPAVTDDFAISTAVVEQGFRLVFEPRAMGSEETMAESGSEFRRRVRLMTRGLRGVLLRRRLMNPFRYGFYSIAFGSRKALRRLLPLAFPGVLGLSVALASTAPVYAALAAVQLGLLSLAAVGWLMRGTRAGRTPVLYAPYFFCLANVASLVALFRLLRGDRIERWTPQRHDGADDEACAVSVPIAGAGAR